MGKKIAVGSHIITIDAEDYTLLLGKKLTIRNGRPIVYQRYPKEGEKSAYKRVSTLARYLYTRGSEDLPATVDVCCINGNLLDCRRRNLHEVPRSERKCRQRGPYLRRNSSKYGPGIYKRKTGKFEANVRHLGKLYFLGSYETVEEARKAVETFKALKHTIQAMKGRQK